jgi:hypothetical protein
LISPFFLRDSKPVLHIDAICGAVRGLCFHMLHELFRKAMHLNIIIMVF